MGILKDKTEIKLGPYLEPFEFQIEVAVINLEIIGKLMKETKLELGFGMTSLNVMEFIFISRLSQDIMKMYFIKRNFNEYFIEGATEKT